jgi:hypothetical protein
MTEYTDFISINLGSNPPSSTNKAKGHLRVAFCFIGGAGADAKYKSTIFNASMKKRIFLSLKNYFRTDKLKATDSPF